MRGIIDRIHGKLDERRTFVFPSEVAAEFYRRLSVRLGSHRAVRVGRFISWDTFKESVFSISRTEQPVNNALRTIFTAGFLADIAGGKRSLGYLIPDEFAGSSDGFLATVRGFLPRLNTVRRLETGLAGVIDPGLLGDLSAILAAYQGFLADHGLFEPSWECADMSAVTEPVSVVFPDVLEDFAAYEPSLANHPRIELLRPFARNRKRLLSFENTLAEVRWLLQDIGGRIESGLDVEDIAVTVPDLGTWEDLILSEARIVGIPMTVRQGRPLLDYPVGRLWKGVRDCAAKGYSITDMKGLLLDRAVPWKDPETARSLARFGIDHRCYRDYPDGDRIRATWKERLKASGTDAQISFFRNLNLSIGAVTSARSFGELQNAAARFTAVMLDVDARSDEERRVFQRAAEVLAELSRLEAGARDFSGISPFSVWLGVLQEQIYVPRVPSGGIPVYAYRVAAGIYPEMHYIVGASHAATEVPLRPYPFLREDYRELLEDGEESLTAEFLDLYAESGSEVIFSYGRESAGGAELPPGHFLSGMIDPDIVHTGGEGLLTGELRYWMGDGELVGPISGVRKRGMDAASVTAFLEPRTDYTGSAVSDPDLRREIVSVLSPDGGFAVSPTSLEGFWNCPFVFLLERVCGVTENEYTVESFDHRLAGSLGHLALARFYERMREEGRKMDPASLGEQRGLLVDILDSLFTSWERSRGGFMPPVWSDYRRKLAEQLDVFLAADAGEFSGFRIEDTEATLAGTASDGTPIEGRVDRIAERDGVCALVDYKKRIGVRRNGMKPLDDVLESYQIPFYLILMEQSGRKTEYASYYGLEDGKFEHVYHRDAGDSWLSPEEAKLAMRMVDGFVVAMMRRIGEGDFTAGEDEDACGGCPFRGVCRKRYRVR